MSRIPTALLERVVELYRPAGLYARRFAAGKLAGDPVFLHLLRNGLLVAPASHRNATTLLDLGCGQGLLGTCCLAARQLAASDQWPADWASPPEVIRYRGIELVERDASRGALAFEPLDREFRSETGDLLQCEFGHADIVVLLDVLHYLPAEDQVPLLAKIHAALPTGGRLIVRIGDASRGLRGRIARWIDLTVWLARTGERKKLHYRSADDWRRLLIAQGFAVEIAAPGPGERFANQLIVARRLQPALSGSQSS